MKSTKRDEVKTKKSQIELPSLPPGWGWATVEALAKSGEQPVLTGPFGSTLGREDFVSTGVPLLTIGCLTESGVTLDKAFYITPEKAVQLDRYQVFRGDLLFSRSASVGRAGLISKELEGSVINYHLMRLRLEASIIDPRFFIYFVRGSSVVSAYLREVNHGATRDGINTTDLLAMPVAVPPSRTQLRIVAKIEELFSDLDAGVAALERIRANLKRYRAAVLKAAVEGRLTEEWRAKHPKTEPASKLLERILAERRQKWEEDQLAKFAATDKTPPKGWRGKYVDPAGPETNKLPELPQGWCWAAVEQIAEVQGGIQKQPKRMPGNNAFPFLRVANVLRDQLDLSEVHRIELFGNELAKLRLVQGDLLIVEGNGSKTEIGRSAIWGGEIDNCVHQNHIIRVRLSVGSPRYVNFYWNSPSGNQRVMAQAASTSGLYTLSVAKVSSLPVPVPPSDEQEQIAAEVEQRLSIIASAQAQVEANMKRAARLRQSILKRAFEGRLVPPDPTDEPADKLLERIRQERAAANGAAAPRTRRGRLSKPQAEGDTHGAAS
jgi:type I restriction enzyme S subunit